MSTARNAGSSVFGTVVSIADAATKAVNTVTSTIDMAALAVSDAKRRQLARSKMDEYSYEETLSNEKAMELAIQDQKIQDWIDEDQERADSFNLHKSKLMAILKSQSQPQAA